MNRMLKSHELAAHLGIDRTTILRWVRSARIPAFRLGGALRFDLEQVQEYLADHVGPKQLAAHLGISVRKVYQLTHARKIPTVEWQARVIRYSIKEVEAALEVLNKSDSSQ